MSLSELKPGDGDSQERSSYIERIKRRAGIKKMLVAGTGAVGKTSLLTVLKERRCLQDLVDNDCEYHRTLFFDMEVIPASHLVNESLTGVFQMVDISGQLELPIHAIRDLSRTALGGVDLVMLVFANDNLQSLIDLSKWLDLLESYYAQQDKYCAPKYVLVRNKCDLFTTVDDGLIHAMLEGNSRIETFFEVSCLTGEGLSEMRTWLAERLFRRERQEENSTQ